MFDLPSSAQADAEFYTAMNSEGSGNNYKFRLIKSENPEMGRCSLNKLSRGPAEEWVFKLTQERTNRRYPRAFLRETVRQVLRHCDASHLCSQSLDLYLIIGVARNCWQTQNSGDIEMHCEEFRNLAYAIVGSVIEAAQDDASIIRT